ncbi:MAG: NifU-like protein involved in Fe-S cluster formation [Candidatus Tokpelaia sp. JSC085]|nr:MAG: NifU-like protein involved in Fe-S cluster formation [Candidatus Tokpelaia sp. JSC085]
MLGSSKMIDNIYNSEILSYAAHISRLGQLANPDVTTQKSSRLCGSTIKVYLKMQNGMVTDFAQTVSACALGQASASIMAQHIIGLTAHELKQLKATTLAMLTENGPPPSGKFSAFSCLASVKSYKVRHASIMLIFDALTDCIEKIEHQRTL